MKTLSKEIGNGFSREDMKKAVAKEEISKERSVELNALASQVAEQFSAKSISPFLISGSLRLVDFLALSMVAIITMLFHLTPVLEMNNWHIVSAFLGAVVTTGFIQGMDGYLTTTLRQFSTSFFKSLIAFTMAFVVTMMMMFLAQTLTTEMTYWVGMWFGYGVVYLTKLVNDGRLERRAIIIGGGQPAAELINAMEANANSDIRICGIFDDRTDDRSPAIVAGYPKLGNVAELVEFTRDWDSVMKRTFDIVFASLAIVALSPIMLLTALAVKLDSKGPIIFKQKREGFNNEEIEIFKFRSLYTDQGDKSGVNVVTKGDSRVTKVGRPHVANAQTDNKLWTEVVDSYIARHKVKPGVTGWAQINGWRGEVDQEEKLKGRVEYDLYYIENWSLLFDLYILAITPLKLINTENAY